jgi:hypothetical protein
MNAAQSAFELHASLEVHFGWTLTGTAALDKLNFPLSCPACGFIYDRIECFVADIRYQSLAKLRNTDHEMNELNVYY